ncbi:transglutaminase family protein [Paucibacter sp. XJ19-41]|nr:transglutaminase family protein [Paucibacter sp. XJ19-41]
MPRSTGSDDLATVRQILQSPDADIDLARAKLMIDRMIDSSTDLERTQVQLDGMVRELRSMLPAGASKRLTMDALRFHMYKASPWNGNRPFTYDLDDPLGTNVRNKLLTTYLATRKGNCVSMPLLFIILGQKLGIDVTAAAAPNHLFVKYRDDKGKLFNLETTSSAGFTRDEWMRQQFPMTDEAIASGIYMRPLTKKETVIVMVSTLLEFYDTQGLQDQRIAMAKLALEHSSKDVSLLLHEHQAYFAKWKQDFTSKYPTPNDIPTEKRALFSMYEERMNTLLHQAYALGWRPRDLTSEQDYRQRVIRAKSLQQP